MASNIDINFDIHNGMEQAWHGLAIVRPENELRIFSGGALDFSVMESDLFDADMTKVDGFRKVQAVRPDGKRGFYNVVKDSYTIIQNKAIFDALMLAIYGVKGKVTYCGSIEGGKRCFINFEPDGNQWRDKEGLEHKTVLSIVWGHDTVTPVIVNCSDVRIVCANTLRLALAMGEKVFKLRHTKNAALKIEGMERIIEGLFVSARQYNESIEQLGNQRINAAELQAFVFSQTVNKDKDGKLATRGLNNANEVIDLFFHGRGNKGNNKSDILNAFTEFYTHGSKESNRDASTVWQSSEFGAYANIKKDVYTTLCDADAYADALTLGRELVKLA